MRSLRRYFSSFLQQGHQSAVKTVIPLARILFIFNNYYVCHLRLAATNSLSMDRLTRGWSIGTRWPASNTILRPSLPASFFTPTVRLFTRQVQKVFARNSCSCSYSSRSTQRMVPGFGTMRSFCPLYMRTGKFLVSRYSTRMTYCRMKSSQRPWQTLSDWLPKTNCRSNLKTDLPRSSKYSPRTAVSQSLNSRMLQTLTPPARIVISSRISSKESWASRQSRLAIWKVLLITLRSSFDRQVYSKRPKLKAKEGVSRRMNSGCVKPSPMPAPFSPFRKVLLDHMLTMYDAIAGTYLPAQLSPKMKSGAVSGILSWLKHPFELLQSYLSALQKSFSTWLMLCTKTSVTDSSAQDRPVPTGWSTKSTLYQLAQVQAFLLKVQLEPLRAMKWGPSSMKFPSWEEEPGPPLSQITVGTLVSQLSVAFSLPQKMKARAEFPRPTERYPVRTTPWWLKGGTVRLTVLQRVVMLRPGAAPGEGEAVLLPRQKREEAVARKRQSIICCCN